MTVVSVLVDRTTVIPAVESDVRGCAIGFLLDTPFVAYALEVGLEGAAGALVSSMSAWPKAVIQTSSSNVSSWRGRSSSGPSVRYYICKFAK